MESVFSDLSDDAVWRRACEASEREGRDRHGNLLPVPPRSRFLRCLKCDSAIADLDSPHECGPSLYGMMRVNRTKVYAMMEKEHAGGELTCGTTTNMSSASRRNFTKERSGVVLTVGGVKRTVR